ncbi:MAG: flagellar assembly protein FliW [Comamonadaceae bacterium]|nr:flagellar assembly protein FliW [Comamonadaceae bacterium]
MSGHNRVGKMLIHAINFGDIEVPEDRILHFKEGVPGFPNLRRFAVLEHEDLKPFQYLQAVEDPPIALLVVNPFLIDPDYKFQLSKSDMEDIRATSTKDVAVYVVATIPDNPENGTVNLMAPIVIHESQSCGKQVILHDSGYAEASPV